MKEDSSVKAHNNSIFLFVVILMKSIRLRIIFIFRLLEDLQAAGDK